MTGKDKVLCAAEQLRDALYVAMCDAGSKPCKIFLSPTPATPIDVCCSDDDCDGQAWVSMVSSKPIYSVDAGFTPCGFETEVLFVLGIARCAHSLDEQGDGPSAEELNDDTEKQMRDYSIMRKATLNLFVPEMDLARGAYHLGSYDSHPVSGGCMAATMELFVRFDCI